LVINFNSSYLKDDIASVRTSYRINGVGIIHKEKLRPEIQGKERRKRGMKGRAAKSGDAF
jgi:hypothetical protein